jgi:hypothetical protein
MKQKLYDKVKKMRLRRGDILVCHDPMTAETLARMKFPFLPFQVPIVVAPLGLERIPADDLMGIAQKARQTAQLIIPGKI